MSYEENGTWVYLVVTIGTYAAYLAVVLGRAATLALAEVAYMSPLGRILVEIAKPSDGYTNDARDKGINRFGEYAGEVVLAVAMAVPFGLALAVVDHFWIANAMYAVFVVSALIGATLKLVAYRRGIPTTRRARNHSRPLISTPKTREEPCRATLID